MNDGSFVGRLAHLAGTMLRPLVQRDCSARPASRRCAETFVQQYGSVEAYLEEQRRCAVYAVDRQVRERLLAA